MLEDLLSKELLTDQDRADGFTLGEDEDFVYVYRHGRQVASFFSSGMTRESLREFLDQTRRER